MKSSIDSLIVILDDTITLLDKHGVDHWANWLRDDAAKLRESDSRAIEHLLSAFGGMGSFNDVYICVENGNRIDPSVTPQVNEKLRTLSGKIYKLANDLKRNA